MNKQNIINDIKKYINENVMCNYKKYYVGISNDPRRRLFNEHNVNEKGVWIICPADSDTVARDVEKYFLDLGMDGGPGGGDETATYVYCYLKTSTTQP